MKLKSRPRITLAVPTRNRAQYLESLVDLLHDFAPDEVEILVVNNASNDSTEQLLGSYKSDTRFRLLNFGEAVNVNMQFERCLRHAEGEWICIIGDDDGIVPSIFRQVIELLVRLPSSVSAVVWPRVIYRWPGFSAVESNILSIPAIALGPLKGKIGSSIQLLKSIASDLKAGYYAPGIYHGLVNVDLARKMLEENPDTTFWGAPDQSFIANLMLEDVHFVHFSKPATVTGYSPASTGGSVTVSDCESVADVFFSENPDLARSFFDFFRFSEIGWTGIPILSESCCTFLLYNKVLVAHGLSPLPLDTYIKSEVRNAHKIPIGQREGTRRFLEHLCDKFKIAISPDIWARYESVAAPQSLGGRFIGVEQHSNARFFRCNVALSERLVQNCRDASLLADSFLSI